jgi:hypothetical protein
MLKKVDNFLNNIISMGILSIFVGTAFFYYGWTTYWQYQDMVANGQRYAGQVVYAHCPFRGPDYLYVRLDDSGREVRVEECESGSKTGDRVTLLSLPDNPDEYRILERGVILELALIAFSVGWIILGFWLLIKWKFKKKKKKARKS